MTSSASSSSSSAAIASAAVTSLPVAQAQGVLNGRQVKLREALAGKILPDLISIVDDYLNEPPTQVLFLKAFCRIFLTDPTKREEIRKEAVLFGQHLKKIDLGHCAFSFIFGDLQFSSQSDAIKWYVGRVDRLLAEYFPNATNIVAPYHGCIKERHDFASYDYYSDVALRALKRKNLTKSQPKDVITRDEPPTEENPYYSCSIDFNCPTPSISISRTIHLGTGGSTEIWREVASKPTAEIAPPNTKRKTETESGEPQAKRQKK